MYILYYYLTAERERWYKRLQVLSLQENQNVFCTEFVRCYDKKEWNDIDLLMHESKSNIEW